MSIGTSPGETVGDSIDESTETTNGSGSSGGLPDWISHPRAWLAGTLLTWVLMAWDTIIGFIQDMWSTLATIPQTAIYQPISTAFALPGEAIQDLWREVGTIAVEVSEVAGPFAPVVVVGVWLIPAIIAVTLLWIVWGILETYLPLESIPGIRRLIS